MNTEEIREKVTQVVRDVLDDDTIVLRSEMKANEVDGWDSLAHITIVVAVEREFKIKFSLLELKNLKTIGGLFDLVGAKIK